MKQMFRYISVLMMLFVSTITSAQSTIQVMTVTNGTVSVDKANASKGELVTITVTPDEGYYFQKENLEVAKTVNPASTRGDVPIAAPIEVSGLDPADLSVARSYTFTVPDDGYVLQVSATFMARTAITEEMVLLSATNFTYNGSDQKPTVSVTGLTEGTDYIVTFAESAWKDVGIYSVSVSGISKYKGTVTKTFTISAADTPDTPEPVVEETPTDDGGKIITTTTTEKLEDGTEKETKVEEKKDAEGNVESVSETIKETKTGDDGSTVESTQTTKTDGEGNFVSSETVEEKKDADGNVEKTTTQAEVPEVSGDAVPVKDETTGKEENYYSASEKTQEKLDKIVGADVAFEENSVQNIQVVETTKEKVTKDGDKSESKSYKLTCQKSTEDNKMSLLGQKKGQLLKPAVGKGKLLAFKKDLVKVTKTNTRGEGDADDNNMIELESGEDYKILQDGDLVLTLKTSESDVEIESISVSEATDEPDEPVNDEPETIKISSAKQVTYMSDKDLDFTGYPDLKAYVATGYDKASGTIWLTRVKEVPANTGFLLMGDADTYEIPVKAGGLSAYYQNMFKGTIEGTTIQTTEGDYTNYYLSNGDAGVGFYKVQGSVELKPNRAYLSVPTEIPAVGAAGSTETIKVSAAGQVPYYNSQSLDFSSLDAQGVKAYTATGYDYTSGTIWLTRVKQVPAETGILIMAPQGEYPVPTASVASVYANMFKGTLTGTTIQTHETIAGEDYINYYLSSGASGVGFYKVTKEEGVTISANRCYLPIKNKEASGTRSTGSGQSQIAFEEADEVIGIPLMRGIGDDNSGTTDLTPALSKGEGEWYTLQGQRVAKPGKGLYIHNGKVVVIRSTTK